jgi:hypothetical protein
MIRNLIDKINPCYIPLDAKGIRGVYGRAADFASFLASGTECHCCLGFRILISFFLGAIMAAAASCWLV